jgi:Putative DNA-binding domain
MTQGVDLIALDNHGSTRLAELANLQNTLLAEIHKPALNENQGEPMRARGLAAYRANAHANALRALEAAYPVMVQLIGDENFAFLARDFWQSHPPFRGDLAEWGDQVAAFVAAAPPLAHLPFLPDVARIEWALHRCAGAADLAQDAPSFARLADCDPSTARFTLAPGACALASLYPAGDITLAHQGQGSLQAAFDLLAQGVQQNTLVWRQGFVPRLRLLHDDELGFAQALLAGQPLAKALDAAHPAFDLSHWLTANVQNGLVLGLVEGLAEKPPD